ncbi:MAG: DUF4230 domain-containing protein [Myxococcota bacterium]
MTDVVEKQPASGNARGPVLIAVAGLSALLLGLLLGGLLDLFSVPEPTRTTTVVRPTPQVLVAVRDLAELRTAEFHMERVIDLRDRQEHLFGLVQADDAILLVAAGDVSAGVDLRQLEAGDVEVDPEAGRAVLRLPAPEIFDSSLDNDRTFVHARETGLLATRSESLETRARQEAERTLEEAALESGILDRAETNAERTLRSLLEQLGYSEVDIRFAPRGSAPP